MPRPLETERPNNFNPTPCSNQTDTQSAKCKCTLPPARLHVNAPVHACTCTNGPVVYVYVYALRPPTVQTREAERGHRQVASRSVIVSSSRATYVCAPMRADAH